MRYRGVTWGAQVRTLLASAARAEPNRPALVDALGAITFRRLHADVADAARHLAQRSTSAPGGYRIITGPSDRRFVTATLATLVSARTPVLTPGHAAALAPALLAEAGGTCRAWRVTLDAWNGQVAALSTCGGPALGDAQFLAALGLRPGDRALIAQPLHTPLALEAALRLVLAGGTVVLGGPFEPERWLRLCAATRPHWALCTPAQLGRLLAVPGADLAAAACDVRTLMIEGQGAPSLRAAALRALREDRLAQYYCTPLYHGATARGATLAAAEPEHTALPGTPLRILGRDANPADPGQRGLIQGRPHSHPLAAACPRPGGTWVSWGERGALSERGGLTVADTRIEGRAVIDGVGVALGRVGAALARHPAVTAVEVTAAADLFGADRLSARVQTENPALDETALRTWCAGNLDPAERPAELIVAHAAPGGAW